MRVDDASNLCKQSMEEKYNHEKVKNSVSEDDSGHSEGVNDNMSLTSEQSEDMVFSDEIAFEDYDNTEQDAAPASPMTNVLVRLDSLLREKINSEVEDFQENLHEILNQHFHIERKVMQLSKPDKNVCPEDDCSRTLFGICSDSTYSLPDDSLAKQTPAEVDSEHTSQPDEKNQKLLELFTSASVISSTIRRPEFTT